ncbi:MAG: AAA family ATPase [Oligoflexales bacterium]
MRLSHIFQKGRSQTPPPKTYRPGHPLSHRREAWLAGLPAHVELNHSVHAPTIIAIGGGKGGVGKSILSSNLAARLGQAGHKVLLTDLDIGGANLHTYFGIPMPQKTLADYILMGQGSLWDTVIPTNTPNVHLAPGGRDESWSDASDFGAGAFLGFWDSILNAKEEKNFDFIIIDLGAGTQKHTIDFFTAAHLGIVTVLPEPTSIENAYSFLKATLWRLIENAGIRMHSCAVADELKDLLFSPNPKNLSSSVERLKSQAHKHPELIKHIFTSLEGRNIGFIVNQIRTQRDIDIGRSMETVCHTYFGFQTTALGYLNYDDAAWKSLRNRRLLVTDFPHAILARRITEVSGKVLSTLGY